MARWIQCPTCGGQMWADSLRTHSTGSALGGGCLLICVGILVFVFIPVVGWIAGPIIGLFGLFYGSGSRKVWKCRQCRSVIDRA